MKPDLNKIFDMLFPIPRSITGKGYNISLSIISKYIPLKVIKYKSGKKVFDWTVPLEWNISDAYVINEEGTKVIDFKKNNLSVVYYSIPVNKTISLNVLQKHLYSNKKKPNLIPYVTSYYEKNWGFCIKHSHRKKLKNGNYRAVIKSNFSNGYVRLGHAELKGKSSKTILISSYICHPSMANNELSGPLALIGLYDKIKKWKNRYYTYKFLINPETIGSICYISNHSKELKKNLVGGLVLTCLGGPKRNLSYKKTRDGNSILDKLFERLSKNKNIKIRNYNANGGSDERQYNSPEPNLPVGQIARTVYKEYDEYHSSGDTKSFMKISQVKKSVDEINKILLLNEKFLPVERVNPNCEIKLSKFDLYPSINHSEQSKYSNNSVKDGGLQKKIILHILAYSDGKHNLFDIAEILNVKIDDVISSYKVLKKNNIVK